MEYEQTTIFPGKSDADSSMRLWDESHYHIPTRRFALIKAKRIEITCHLEDFAVSAGHRVKVKEIETPDKLLNLLRDGKFMEDDRGSDINQSWSHWKSPTEFFQVTSVIWEIIDTIGKTARLRSARLLRRVMEIWSY